MVAPKPTLAIYGGAFNPPTLGHAAVAESLVNAGFERILVMPCFGHTFGKSLAPASERLVLSMDAFRDLPLVRVSSFEIDLGMNGSTYELVTKLPLLPEHASHQVFMAIGSDEANAIDRWRRNVELRAMIPFVVVMRPGHPLAESGRWASQAPHKVVPHDGNLIEASSTSAKGAIAAGDFELAQRYLNPRVLHHIQKRGLYQNPMTACA